MKEQALAMEKRLQGHSGLDTVPLTTEPARGRHWLAVRPYPRCPAHRHLAGWYKPQTSKPTLLAVVDFKLIVLSFLTGGMQCAMRGKVDAPSYTQCGLQWEAGALTAADDFSCRRVVTAANPIILDPGRGRTGRRVDKGGFPDSDAVVLVQISGAG